MEEIEQSLTLIDKFGVVAVLVLACAILLGAVVWLLKEQKADRTSQLVRMETDGTSRDQFSASVDNLGETLGAVLPEVGRRLEALERTQALLMERIKQ